MKSQNIGLLDELTRRVSAALEQQFPGLVRDALLQLLSEDKRPASTPSIRRTAQAHARARRKTRKQKKFSLAGRAARNEKIVAAVGKLGTASSAQVIKATGFDRRGMGSSLYFLVKAGKLKKLRGKKYRVAK